MTPVSKLVVFPTHSSTYSHNGDQQTSRTSPSLQALSACYTSALEALQIVTKDFADMGVLVRKAIPRRPFGVIDDWCF